MADDSKVDFKPGPVSSPPCFMHEVDPVYMGLSPTSSLQAGGPVDDGMSLSVASTPTLIYTGHPEPCHTTE